MLSSGAFNALLKTLEEPPSYAVFILATTEKHKVPATILSRCQIYDFQRITVADIIHYLQYVASQEGISATEDALNVVAQKADGGMRDALSIFDQLVAFCGNTLTYERAIEVLNVLDTEYYFHLTEMLLHGEVHKALLLFNEVLEKGFDAGNFMSGFAQHLRDVLVSHDAATVSLIETSDSIRRRYMQQAASTPATWIFKALNVIVDAEAAYRVSKNKRLSVELMLIKLASLTNQQPAAQAAQPAPVAQPMPQPAAQAPRSAQPVTPPAPVQSQTVSRQDAPKAPQDLPLIPNLPGIPKMPSIQPNNVSASQPQAAVAPQSAEQRNSPFTADQVSSAWVGLKAKFSKEQRLIAMLDAHRPTLIDDHTALVTFVNPWQEEEFKHFNRQILTELHNSLQNDLLQLRTVVSEAAATTKAYTAEEKYKLLLEMNPYLGEFKKRFNMLLE